ncbi:MAG TPA: hypothetical protein VHK06_06350 [Candidatus Limnocylindria bacterium]|nr:hypothetical protein [Candidatus Limnocylindria bacterium]
MTTPYAGRRRGRGLRGALAFVDDFTSWLLYGRETWLVALLKGVPLFLYLYFLVAYVPNYVYYLVTVEIPFLRFSEDVGFVIAAMVGGGNFFVLIILALWTQAARGRRGFGWELVRVLNFLQYLFVMLLLIPLMAFNLAGGSLWPLRFPLAALAFGTLVAGLGAASLVYLYFEYRRITRREAEAARERGAAYAAG